MKLFLSVILAALSGGHPRARSKSFRNRARENLEYKCLADHLQRRSRLRFLKGHRTDDEARSLIESTEKAVIHLWS